VPVLPKTRYLREDVLWLRKMIGTCNGTFVALLRLSRIGL
jgi:hypothetical protein